MAYIITNIYKIGGSIKIHKYKLINNVGIWVTILSLLLSVFFYNPIKVNAESNQEKINRLNKEIQQYQDAANAKHSEANTLKDVIADLNAEISTAQKALDLTSAQIADNASQIERANQDLDRQKGILKDNLKVVYKQGEVTPIEIIASSKNLSDFVSQQEYYSAIKKRIDQNLIKIEELKKELDQRKAELTELSTKQKGQVNAIAEKRAQQASLLAKTQGEEANYQKVASDLSAQRKQAEDQARAQAAAAAAAFRSGNLVSLGNVNAGDIVGYMGSTGNSTGTHLHFSVLDSSGGFINPNGSPFDYRQATTGVVTQNYGSATCSVCGYSFHNGIDIANPSNPPVRAVASGQIIFNGWDPYGFGHKVMIMHPNGYITLYAHLLN